MENALAQELVLTFALTLVLGVLSCRSNDSSRSDVEAVANSYVQLALELGERDTDSLDFAIIPEAMRVEAHKNYPSIHEIHQRADELAHRLQATTVPPNLQPRAAFLAAQLAALSARASMLEGHHFDFDTEAGALFDTERLPDTHAEERQHMRTQIAALLPSPHGREDLAQRYAGYSRQFVIPPAKLMPVMNAALKLCRARTLVHIQLPANESIDIQLVHDKPWAAFSRYMGHAHSVISLNVDMPMTVDDVLELACHEGYPGHHVFNALRDVSLVQQQGFKEAGVQPTFSPQSYLSEAAAAYAPEMAFSVEERTLALRDVLMPLAGIPSSDAGRLVKVNSFVRQLDSAEPAIARDYVDGRLEFVRAEQALSNEVLMAGSESVLLYLNEYRSYMLAYTDGPRRVEAELAPAPTSDARWKAYEHIMQTMQFHLDAHLLSTPAK